MKNVIVTGANSGLGFETAKKIAANDDYNVILACRNPERASNARNSIVGMTKNHHVEFMQIDLASLDSVRSFAEAFHARGEKLYALVNNAGISSSGNAGLTEDGFDCVMQTNYLGHFLLTQLLLPCMEESGRIYSVSSDMHIPPSGELTWPGTETLVYPQGKNRNNYSFSKLCLIYMTHELSGRLREEEKRITVNAFNPGFMDNTNFQNGGKLLGFVVKHKMPERYGNLEKSSDALAALVTGDEFAEISGEYFDRSVFPARSSELSYNCDNAKELWDASLRYTGLM